VGILSGIDERISHDEVFVRVGIKYHWFLMLQDIVGLSVSEELASAQGEAKVNIRHNFLFIYHNWC
jgi:hypothetical protein